MTILFTSNMLTFYTVAKLGFLRYWIEKDPLTIFLLIYICFVIANKEILRPCKTGVVGSSPTCGNALAQLVEHVKKLFITFFTRHLFLWKDSNKRVTSPQFATDRFDSYSKTGVYNTFLDFLLSTFSIKFLTTNKLRGLYAL